MYFKLIGDRVIYLVLYVDDILLVGRKPIGSKWVFKKKTNAEGKVEKFKAHLVAKGYSQVPGIDFGDIFSHVAKVASIRLLLYVAATFDFEVE